MKPISCWTGADGSVKGLRAMFDAAALSLTVGAEEELMLVDPRSGRLVGSIEQALSRVGGDSRFRPELRATQVELVTRTCLSAADAGRELSVARLDLGEAIRPVAAAIACGTHPAAVDPGPISRGERYEAIARDNPWAARGMLTCGLHIHVGVTGADRALAVYNALRSYLPELAALSANSPFHAGRSTGLASTRMQLNRSLVRHGVPPAFPAWSAYAAFTAWGRAGGAIPDPSYHWWDLRLHPGCGTVEIRVCDAQTELDDAVSLIALAQALVAWLAERYDAGEALPVHDGYRIAESLWLAAHVGTARDVLDLETGARRPLAERVESLLGALEPTARELGTERELARLRMLATFNGADRQRQVVEAKGVDRLIEWVAAETTASARRYREHADRPGRARAVGVVEGRGARAMASTA